MKHGSLFSGIGGFDLAAEWMGWENIFHCEINPFCQKVLKYHFPHAESLTDITKTDFSKYNGTIDVISGGFPCQPYSLAGKRKGKEDERHLWPEMLRAIREIQPRWVVGENVFGLVNWSGGLVFDEVQTNLEAEGYEVFPYVLPACAVNAPHRRDRVWFVAYSNSCGNNRAKGSEESIWQHEDKIKQRGRGAMQINRLSDEWLTANADGLRLEKHELQQSELCEQSGKRRITTNTSNTGLQGIKINGGIRTIGQNGNEQLAGCIPSIWKDFPTQSPLCGRNDGVPDRVDRIKALGNAIVPQVAFEIFKAIEQTELNFFANTYTK